ncbi:RNA-binding protein, putative [Plasmodium knowlesi strain H]|uniref:RNA-binding protein, putative n=3 Tax=Plasmodium knowlesi TaxID=5850 RepID=A0A5K1UT16_PLAKH|nr:RNA-binding protein, putative [Plasmodium knowlesi strain H]OTN64145.1 putative RNA-binding protein [Plasmodium knowlesi]CAA9991202.1 RNA-binding protein, putative [Plasmodium knowlesi strain H]SBO26258.1 RNA-binding protein, putative [Plasmodium knowlesi strain H]SBO29409.1 RNA-binding protein, putative [Plasmodium knowlesi strain H]VVS80676.1 RNA-binding protein, putative [Plasmodium knowlesi strain H]|eukprot:XP_002262485.1 hypothetical protein, conserved in Plasmodium species [Plasmodium knowlesi strain H]
MNKITVANRFHDHMYNYLKNQPMRKEEFTYYDGKQMDINSMSEDASIFSGTSLGEEKMNSTNTQQSEMNKRSADQNENTNHIVNAALDRSRKNRSNNNGMNKCIHNNNDNPAYNNDTSSISSKSSFVEQKKGSAFSGTRKKNNQVSSSICGAFATKVVNGTELEIPSKGNNKCNTIVRGVGTDNADTDIVVDGTMASVISCHNRRTGDIRNGKLVPNFGGRIYGEVNVDEDINYHPIRYERTDGHVDMEEKKKAQVLNEGAFEQIGTNLLGKENTSFEDPFANNFSGNQHGFSNKIDLSNISLLVNHTNGAFERSEEALIAFDKCANRERYVNSEDDDESRGDVVKKGELGNMPSGSFSTYYKSDSVEEGTTSSDVKEVSPVVSVVYDCGNSCGNPCVAEKCGKKQWKRGSGKRDPPSSDNKGKTSIDCGDRSSEEPVGSNNDGIGKEGKVSGNNVHRSGSVGNHNKKGNRGNKNKHQNRKNNKRKNIANKAERGTKDVHAEVGGDGNATNDTNDINDTNDTNDTNDINDADDFNDISEENNLNGECTKKNTKTTNGANSRSQKNGVEVNQKSYPPQNDRNNAAQTPNGVDDLVNLATVQNCANSRGSPVDSSNASTMKSAGEDVDLLFFRENDNPLEEHYMVLQEDDYGVNKMKERAEKKDTVREKGSAGFNNTFNILRNNLYHIFSDSCDEQWNDECLLESLDEDADRSRNGGTESVSFVDNPRGDLHRSDMHRIDMYRLDMQRDPMQSTVGQKGLAQSGFMERDLMERALVERGFAQHELTQRGLIQRALINQWGAEQPPLYKEDAEAEKEDKLGINDLRADRSAFRGQHPLSDAQYSGLLQAPCMSGLMGNVPYAPTVRGIVLDNKYGLSGVAGVSSIGNVGGSVVNNPSGHVTNGAHQSTFVLNNQKRTNFSGAAGKLCGMETHQSNFSGNAINGKENGNTHKSKKTGNENMIIERPVTLNNSQMLEAFMQGRLCLSCDSLDHPMPLCPNNSFVCPNCHNISHRGNDCPMKCRFCLKYHVGVSIMDCLKKARIQSEKNFPNEEKNETNKVGKNTKSQDDRVSVGPRFDITTRPDNSYGRSVYVSNLSEDITNVQLRDAINNHLDNGYVVNIDRQDGYAFVELSNLNSTFQLVQKSININFRKLKIQFKKTGQFLIPDNLSLSANNLATFGLHRGAVGGATLVQTSLGKNATTAVCRKNPSNGASSNALSTGSAATSGNGVELCTKLRLGGTKGGSNNTANGATLPGGTDGKGKYACKLISAKHPKDQQQKKQHGQLSQPTQLAQVAKLTQATQLMQLAQATQSVQSVEERKNRQKDNLKQGRAIPTDGVAVVDNNPRAKAAILIQKKNKLVGEKNQEKGRRGRLSDGTVSVVSNGDGSYGAVDMGSMFHGFKNPYNVEIPNGQILNLQNDYLLAQHLDGAKIGTVSEGLTRSYYDFMCTNGLSLKSGNVRKTIDVNNVPLHLPSLYSSGTGNCANDLFTNEVAKVGFNYEGSNIPLKMANDMNEKNELHKSMTTETSKTTATTTTASDNMLNTQLFNGVSPLRRSLNKSDDMMKETHLPPVMHISGAPSMNGKLTRCLNPHLEDGMFASGSMSLSRVGERDRANAQFGGKFSNQYGGIYLDPCDRFTSDRHNDSHYHTRSGNIGNGNNNSSNNISGNRNGNVSEAEAEGRPNIDLKSIVDNAIEVNHDTMNYDQLSFSNALGEGLLHDELYGSSTNAPVAYTLGECDISDPYHSNENNTEQNKTYSNKQGIDGPSLNFEVSMNGNNIWKDKNDDNSGSGHTAHLENSYNKICDDMFFGNQDIYDVFSRFNGIKLDKDSGDSAMCTGAINGRVSHPFPMGSNQHNDRSNGNPSCGQNVVNQVPPSAKEEKDEENKIKFDEADNSVKFVNLSSDMFQQLSDLSTKEDVDLMGNSYVNNIKYKELDAIEKDLEKHIKALWNLRKIKLVKSHDLPHHISQNEFV